MIKKEKLTIVIPAAGEGSRFKEEGYKDLKPFIDINGKRMIELVIDGFKTNKYDVSLYVIMQDYQIKEYKKVIDKIEKQYKWVKFKSIKNKIEGTVCTILSLYEELNNDSMLLSANCDQLAGINIDDFIDEFKKYDGSLLTFRGEKSPNWSFVKEKKNIVVEVADKNPISDVALLGWYFWKKSSDFLKYQVQLIVENKRTNGEFMQNLTYNYMIENGGCFII